MLKKWHHNGLLQQKKTCFGKSFLFGVTKCALRHGKCTFGA